jgi:hypothetical protein
LLCFPSHLAIEDANGLDPFLLEHPVLDNLTKVFDEGCKVDVEVCPAVAEEEIIHSLTVKVGLERNGVSANSKNPLKEEK